MLIYQSEIKSITKKKKKIKVKVALDSMIFRRKNSILFQRKRKKKEKKKGLNTFYYQKIRLKLNKFPHF
jgi:hypothetical protein